MNVNLQQMTIQFLKHIGFMPGAKIWLRISWDLPVEFIPNNWNCYWKNEQLIYSHYIFCGKITPQGFTLYCCTQGGRDRQGNTCWQLTPKRYTDGWALAFKFSYLGATVSFYPNQPNKGISNDHVSRCRCLFYEIDDLPLTDQHDALERFKHMTGLEPAAVVYTGGKSLHVYFRCSFGLSPENWILLNRKLAIAQNADPAICNLARSMRLPGMVRREVINRELSSARAIALEGYSTSQYSFRTLNAALDATGLFPYGLSDQQWRKWVQLVHLAKMNSSIDPRSALTQSPIPMSRSTVLKRRRHGAGNSTRDNHLSLKQHRASGISIPLSICLTKSDRALLKYGELEGNRNNAGYKLARNLLGTTELLTRHRIAHHPDPYQLFEQYCDRCTPALDDSEAKTIWQSANKTPAFTSRTLGSILTSISRWQS
ncbi:hypothetical protein C7B61_00615 [filamentous cyanobacterium CCP1]|nr:hypothetical protein C7B76_00400 [filamentous cyanobacterium CCP2]PSB68481.1 hypothetical protein C7B61_00615 [filamentous cyanobacterium CCP1]